jgi:hypothetical protein
LLSGGSGQKLTLSFWPTAYADAVKSGNESHGLAGFCRVVGEAEFGL